MKKYIREPFPALSHLLGAGLSMVGLFFLIEKSADSLRAVVASAIFGVSLIVLYLASALTHGLHCSEETLTRIEKYDYAAIFLLIAGTYTPVCLLIIRGPLGWGLLISEWTLAAFGVSSIFFRRHIPKHLRVAIYLIMGWLFLIAINPIISTVPQNDLAWLIGGGLAYSIGSIVFLTNKPNFWRGYFEAHDLWHLFVLAGSTCHFIFIDLSLVTFK
jgi:hemolysin III